MSTPNRKLYLQYQEQPYQNIHSIQPFEVINILHYILYTFYYSFFLDTRESESAPAETATPAPVEKSPDKFPAAAPGNSLDGKGDSRGNNEGASSPPVTTKEQTTQCVTRETQTTQPAVTETGTSGQSSNIAVDLKIDLTVDTVAPTTPIVFATWFVTVFIYIAFLLYKYTSLFHEKKKQSPKSKRRKRRSTIERELNTPLAWSDSATEYCTECGS
ncbi:KIR-like protein [Plasmodium coatneyi]|uniref:KIR-like protein n=1 Tax=Plasmodium coatneyi TaxID=208452 RepID=A0A1B1DWE4_9APIC|nr:KIR-like protein [Plasmodium coatneyi]ANQ07074.1 KIR-like protein [Plasmodium coatneyi]